MITKLLNSREVKFLFVGGTATLLQMLILAVLVEAAALNPVLSSTIGYAISSVYNYGLNYYLTFASTKSHLETFPKFVLVALIGVASNAATMALLVFLGVYYLIAQIGAILVTLVLNFLLHKFWIYRS